KGYGFIQPDAGGKDAFEHLSAVDRAGLRSLADGQRLPSELVAGRGGREAAENLVILDA
ncbi:MAG: cold-shock protein, partial [Rhodospirillaceae bacterium]